MKKALTTLILIAVLSLCLAQSKKEINHYSYLPKPPISLAHMVSPDKSTYLQGDIITFNILATLDTLRCDPEATYGVYFGNLPDMLSHSELIDSDLRESYTLTRRNNSLLISFKVKMTEKYTPPYIKVTTFRDAPFTSANKKQFFAHVIDEYAASYITSNAYTKIRNSDVNSTDY